MPVTRFGVCCKKVVGNWSRTQRLNLTQQLEQGVRYVDMRSAYLASERDFFFVHGLYGPKVSELLKMVARFLDAHPREVVVLDFNHTYFDGQGESEKDVGDRFWKMVVDILGEKMFPIYGEGQQDADGNPLCRNGVLTIGLHDFWKQNKQILAISSGDITHKGRSYFWPERYISSPWFDTDSTATLVKKLNGRFAGCKRSQLNVFQGILSPQNVTIAVNFMKTLEDVLCDKADQAVHNWLQDVYEARREGVNIVICDFVGKSDLVRSVLRLNEIIGVGGTEKGYLVGKGGM